MPANKYSDSLLMDALRGSLSNAESFGRGFGVAPVGLLGDINALAREYITPRLPANVQGLLQSMPSAPTTESILSAIPRMTAPRMESSGMEQIGAAANPRGPINLGRAVASLPSDVARAGQEFLQTTAQPMYAVNLPKSISGRIGNITPESKTEVKNLAETFAEEINKLGFSAKVEHSGSKAGASSYINVTDPLTGRFLSKPIRISDHSKGAKESQGVIDILNPQDDFKKITDALGEMRGMGETLVFKQNKYADELIASGVKPKTAYQRAKTEITEIQPSFQYPQEQALKLAQERAALPVEQGGLGLIAENTPEMRAKAMGFDTPAYHGTASKDIQKFMPEGGTPEGEKTLEWYKNRQAQNEPVGYMAFRGGSFFSPKPEYAGSYAPEGTGVVYPVKLRMDNPLSLLPNAQGRYSATNAPDINKTIDAMILQDALDKSINEIAIIDPAQIRSRFAAFDPFRKDVATATAMGVALPDLLAAEYNPQPQSAGLLYPLP